MTGFFVAMIPTQISEEVILHLNEAMEARKTVKNPKGDLSNKIKMAIYIAMTSVQYMAMR